MDKISTDTVNNKVLSMYREGFSCKDISLICNLPILNIRHFLQEAGYNTRIYRRASDSNKDKVLLLIKAGYSYSQIEQLLHISTHLIREIVAKNGLIGFSPRYHHPLTLDIEADCVSVDSIRELRELYFAGEYGLVKCADLLKVSDQEFLWFVYHLTEEDKNIHTEYLKQSARKLSNNSVPVTAIAKVMDVSPSIVKKMLK